MTYKKIEMLRVDLEDGFYVDITPSDEEGYREFWLYHKDRGVAHFMFGTQARFDEEAVELACANAPEYIADFEEGEE